MKMAGAGKLDEPPGKKRKLEDGKGEVIEDDDDLWDDGDIQLTQDQWQNIDQSVDQMLSQKPPTCNKNVPNKAVGSVAPVGKSPRGIGRGMPRSHSAGSYSRPAQPGRNVNQRFGTASNQGIVPVQFPRNNTPTYNNRLTPNTASSSISPALPTQAKPKQTLQSTEKLEQDLEHYKKEIKNYQSSQYGKDGQITMLKKSLAEKERLLNQMHQDKIAQAEQQAKVKSEKERSLEAELEKLQTQLKFKEHEVAELQSTCKKLEQKSSNSEGGISPRRPPPASPRSHRSPSVSSQLFPTKQTFMENNHKQGAIPTPSTSVVRSRANLFMLNISNSKGAIDGGGLVGKLMASQCSAGHSHGLVSLLGSSPTIDSTPATTPPANKRNQPSTVLPTETCNHNTGINLPNYQLVKQGVNDLLKTSDYTCSKAVLLLPAIEDQLTAYLNACRLSDIDGAAGVVAAAAAYDENTDSSLTQQPPPYERHLELAATNSITLLCTLSSWCSHVRAALLNELLSQTQASCSLLSSHAQDDSAVSQLSDYVEMKSVKCEESQSVRNIVNTNDIRNKLLQLARPKLPNGFTGCLQIIKGSLQILAQVAQSASVVSTDKFGTLFSGDVIQQCLSPSVRENDEERLIVHLSALNVLCPMMRFPQMLKLMCANKDDCLFHAVYTAAAHALHIDSPYRTQLAQRVLQLVDTVMCQEDESQLRLESDCQCSHQVVRCIVKILHAELMGHQQSPSEYSKTVLRQGVSCLQSLSLNDRNCTIGIMEDVQNAHLIYSMTRLMKDDNVSELEMMALQDLWDFFELDSDQSEEQEMAVDKA